MVLPACVAWMVQVPKLTRVTVAPDTVHTVVVSEPKLAGKPEVAVALSAGGVEPSAWLPSGPNVIVCDSRPTEKVCVTGVAGA